MLSKRRNSRFLAAASCGGTVPLSEVLERSSWLSSEALASSGGTVPLSKVVERSR
jgi:hypothetical protein